MQTSFYRFRLTLSFLLFFFTAQSFGGLRRLPDAMRQFEHLLIGNGIQLTPFLIQIMAQYVSPFSSSGDQHLPSLGEGIDVEELDDQVQYNQDVFPLLFSIISNRNQVFEFTENEVEALSALSPVFVSLLQSSGNLQAVENPGQPALPPLSSNTILLLRYLANDNLLGLNEFIGTLRPTEIERIRKQALAIKCQALLDRLPVSWERSAPSEVLQSRTRRSHSVGDRPRGQQILRRKEASGKGDGKPKLCFDCDRIQSCIPAKSKKTERSPFVLSSPKKSQSFLSTMNSRLLEDDHLFRENILFIYGKYCSTLEFLQEIAKLDKDDPKQKWVAQYILDRLASVRFHGPPCVQTQALFLDLAKYFGDSDGLLYKKLSEKFTKMLPKPYFSSQPFVFHWGFSNEEIADALTMVESRLLSEVPYFEANAFFNGKEENSIRFARLSQFFNNVNSWFSNQIVIQKSKDEKLKLLARFIDIGKLLYKRHNFDGLMIISLVCENPDFSSLGAELPRRSKNVLKKLSNILRPQFNFANYHKALSSISNGGPRIPIIAQIPADILHFKFKEDRDYLQFIKSFIDTQRNSRYELSVSPALLNFFENLPPSSSPSSPASDMEKKLSKEMSRHLYELDNHDVFDKWKVFTMHYLEKMKIVTWSSTDLFDYLFANGLREAAIAMGVCGMSGETLLKLLKLTSSHENRVKELMNLGLTEKDARIFLSRLVLSHPETMEWNTCGE